MSIIKETILGVFSGTSKILKGVGKGLDEGFQELGQIPANIRYEKKKKLSGSYTLDIGDGETVTINFKGGLFMWDIDELNGKPLSDKDWEELSESEQIRINMKINSWANDIYKKNGLRV